MSSPGYSANPSNSSPPPSLAELRFRLLADESLPLVRRRDMASALASLAKALGRLTETIPADPKALRARMKGLTPAMVGLKAGRWRNVQSLVSTALAHYGLVLVQGRIRAAPAPEWLAILQLLDTGAGRHFHLWRFARYCTQTGITPPTVNDAAIAKYQDDLTKHSLVTEPERAAREVARFWNEAATIHSNWPQQRLSVPDNRRTYAPSWDAYPESLIRDIEAWCTGLGDTDPFAARVFRPSKPASVATRRKQVRIYLGALVAQGVTPADLVDLAAVVTPPHAELALRFVWERADRQATHHTYQMASMALMIAKHWEGQPEADLKRLSKMATQLRPISSGLTGRNMARLRQLEDPDKLHSLLNLPSTLVAKASSLGASSVSTALLVQTAVAVELLLHVPMRMTNLRNLRIGMQFLCAPKDSVSISVAADEVKNAVAIEARLPDATAKMIVRYIDRYRPLLAEGESDYLSPGTRPDAPKSDQGFRSQIQKALADICGIRFNPHSFRHLAAYIVLKHNPGGHGQVQRILAHKSLRAQVVAFDDEVLLGARDCGRPGALRQTARRPAQRTGERTADQPRRTAAMTSGPARPQHAALTITEWPLSARHAWDAALHRPDFLDEGGRGSEWRAASQRTARGAYGRWLAWLIAQSVDLQGEAPAERMTPARVRAYVAFLRVGRCSVTVASYLGVLCMVVVALFPGHTWRWLQAGQGRLKRSASPTRGKQRRLVPAGQLLQLGLDLIQQASQGLDGTADPAVAQTKRVAAARDFRDGLLIALLASRPLRVKNLLQTEVGTHLRQSGTHTTLHYGAAETKTHRPYDMVWPEALGPALARYLAEVRPMLITAAPRTLLSRPPGPFLWLAQGGTPLAVGALYKAVNRHTRRRFGHAVTAHLFRDSVASTLANEDPDHVRYAAQLLGHASLQTTERSYIAADSTTALGLWSDMIESLRSTARKQRRARGQQTP
jgi:integrase